MLDRNLNAETIDMSELLSDGHELLTNSHQVAGSVVSVLPLVANEVAMSLSAFRDKHGMTPQQFTSLRRKAERRNPGLVFVADSPDGKQVYHIEKLEALIEPKQTPAVEAELIETSELSNGGALTVSKHSYMPNLPAIVETRDYQTSILDTSEVLQLVDTIQKDLEAEREAKRVSKLIEFANDAMKEQADRALIESLIAKGYSPQQAVKIAMGVS